VVDLLILRGADLHLANNYGSTALMMAAKIGHFEVVKFLVEKGAVVDHVDNDGGTALCQAPLTGHLEIAEFLVSAGANVNHLDAKGISPLHSSALEGQLKVVKLLVKKGADIHQASRQGVTPLHVAALKGHQEVADYLMSKGATFEATGTLDKCCGAADAPLKCGLCLSVYYCCKACQERDWKEGGENRHKVQCKNLIEIKARYVEKSKREIEEKMARFGMQDSAGKSGGGAGPSA
jgi:ankyrin repeat protein